MSASYQVVCFTIALFCLSGITEAQDLPGISLVWSRSVGGLRSFALSQQGRRLALITSEGKLAVWTAQEAARVWATAKQQNLEVAVSDGIGSVLTYDPRAILNGEVVIRRADTGVLAWKKNFGCAVWSVAFNSTGTYVAIGTGDDTVTIFDLVKKQIQTKITLMGTPVSLRFQPSSDKLFIGLWDESGISCYDLTGKILWHVDGDSDRTYSIEALNSRFLTYTGSSIRQGKSPVAYVIRTENGSLLWAYNFESSDEAASADSTDNAQMTAISYASPRRMQSGTITEQRLAFIDRSGQMEWEKGGLFWAPTLICVTPDQDGMVVYDGQKTLYRLDSQGRTVAKTFLSDVLRAWSVSADHTSLLVYTHDGQLSLLHIQ